MVRKLCSTVCTGRSFSWSPLRNSGWGWKWQVAALIQDQFCWVGEMDPKPCDGEPVWWPTMGSRPGAGGSEGWGYIAEHPLKLKRRCGFWEGIRESQRSRSAPERLQSLRRNKTCIQGNIRTGSVIHAIWVVPADCCVVWEGEAGHSNCEISTCQLLPISLLFPFCSCD